MSKYEKQFELYLRTIGADLPTPAQEYRFHATRRWRFDFAWPAAKVAVDAMRVTQIVRSSTRRRWMDGEC